MYILTKWTKKQLFELSDQSSYAEFTVMLSSCSPSQSQIEHRLRRDVKLRTPRYDESISFYKLRLRPLVI